MRPLTTLAAVLGVTAISGSSPRPSPTPDPGMPFAVGERFTYAAKLGVITLGSASMSVPRLDTIRGVETYVFRFHLEGGTFFFSLNDEMLSWTSTKNLISLRFHQDFNEDGRIWKRYFEILPDSGHFWQEEQSKPFPTPERPLDDAAFFYFIRTTPIEVGKTYQYDRYFKKEMNPVIIKVLKREEMELPGGRKVKCVVLSPVVGNDGMFAPRAEAKLWLTDDARRIPVQIRSRLSFGTVTLRLTEMQLPDLASASTGN